MEQKEFYQAPQKNQHRSMETINLYSPAQVALTSFICGPLVTVFCIYKNYVALEQHDDAKKTIPFGIIFIIVLIALSLLLPSAATIGLTVGYAIAGRYVVENIQMSKGDIEVSTNHDFHSNWRVAGFGVLFFILFMVIMLITIFIYDIITAYF